MTASKRGTAVGLPQRVFLRLFAVHRQRTATHMGNSTPARHSSAAQFVSALLQTVSPKINCIKRINSQVPSVISRLTSCATRVSSRGPSLALRAIHLVLRLRRPSDMCSRTVSGTAYRFRHGSTLCSPTEEKILCRSPISQRSHVGNLRQTLPKGSGS